MPTASTDFTLELPAMDSDLMPEWLYEPGPEIPLTQDDVRRLYRNSTCTTTEDSLSLGYGSIRAPSPAELQSLWDDSESDSGSDDEPFDDEDDDENLCVSDADTDSTSATLHDAPVDPADHAPSTSALKQPQLISPPSPPSPRRHPDDLLRLYAYSSADPDLATCLHGIDEALLCNPFSVYADVCYNAAVKREPQNGGVSRGSNELERVTEEDETEEAESEESEDEDEPVLHSPIQTGVVASNWTSGVYVGNAPSEALSALALPAPYHATMDSKPGCFVSPVSTN
ncbi:hypothetical protein EUX98_g6369 [Antrodiella citrinella]|uniref:Uncharacterized protein n=1 Tax=Antrodiella citrinella TaxID=2447956 RepID=A0A4S4MPF2_9APHY|nr:hypothetical protein EUX98_g6369 [Antrodiella citrinella]